ncbi:MAG: Ig-like domain-containing protein [Myxococcota bacterium]
MRQFAVIIGVGITMVACGDGFIDKFKGGIAGAEQAPRVIATAPVANMTDVGLNAIISVTFDKPIDAASVTSSSFTVSEAKGTINVSGAVATFVADSSLQVDTTYDVTIAGTVRDLAGNRMGSNYTWSFHTTTNAQDLTAPIVVSTYPTAGATDVALDSAISATFSEAMDPSSIDGATFRVDGGLTGSVSYNGATAIFTPDAPMSGNNTYTATISTGATDLAGLSLSEEFTWSFSTAQSAVATLTWDVVTKRVDSTAVVVPSYRVYFGSTSRHAVGFSGYDDTQQVSSTDCDAAVCTAQVHLPAPGTYYFAVKAIDAGGVASDYSPDEPSRLY